MKKRNRALSVFMAICMLFTLFSGLQITTHAAVLANSFTPRTNIPDASAGWIVKYNVSNNCTRYVYGRISEILGQDATSILGVRPGADGFPSLLRNAGYSSGSVPKPGSVMCTSGHVAIVESVNTAAGSLVVSEGHSWADMSGVYGVINILVNGKSVMGYSTLTEGSRHGTWFDTRTIYYNKTNATYFYLVASDVVIPDPPKPPAVDYSEIGEGNYNIVNVSSGLYLNAFANAGQAYVNKSNSTSTNICVSNGDGTNEQKFRIQAIGGKQYYIRSLSNDNQYCVNAMSGSSVNSGNDVKLWEYNSDSSKFWYFKSAGNDSYYILNVKNPNVALTAANNSHRANVTVQTYSGSSLQQWRLVGESKPPVNEHTTHSYSASVTKNPTCTEQGIRTYTCTVCGKSYTEAVAALGHNYGNWQKLNDSQHQRVCARDASHIETQNHNWDTGTIVREPTEQEEGLRKYYCSSCGAVKNETIEKLPKTFPPDVIDGGTFGEAIWMFDKYGTLTLSGYAGQTEFRDEDPEPDAATGWRKYSDQIKKIIIGADFYTSSIKISDDEPIPYFYGLPALEAFEVSDDNEAMTSIDGVLFSKSGESLIRYPQAKDGESYIIPDGVQYIGSDAFEGTSLSSVTIPASVRYVLNNAFRNTPSLENVTFLGYSQIEKDAFDVSRASDIWFRCYEGSVAWVYAGEYGFLLDPRKDISLDGSTDIKDSGTFLYAAWTLDNQGTLTFSGYGDSVYMVSCIPENNASMDWMEYGPVIKKIVIDKDFSTVYLGNFVSPECGSFFYNMPALEAFEVSEENEDLMSEAGVLYSKNGDVLIRYPEGLETEEFTVPETVREIANEAFYSAKLAKIELPEGIPEINSSSFSYCGNLAEINIPDSVNSVMHGAFEGTAIYNNEANWQNGVLYYDGWLLAVDSENFEKDLEIAEGTVGVADNVFEMSENIESVTFPISVKYIGVAAFSYCSYLNNVELPDALQIIGDDAFCGTGIVEIAIPDSVLSLGVCAFASCEELTKAVLPDELGEIPFALFCGCPNLTDVELPCNITAIGGSAFKECGSLETVDIPDSVEYIGFNAFEESGVLLHGDYIDGVRYYDNWILSADTDAIEGSLTIKDGTVGIAADAFSFAEHLREVALPEGLMYICDDAFCDCTGLQSVSLPKSLLIIGEGAFAYCESLKSVIVPASVENVRERAFFGCPSLLDVTVLSDPEIGDRAFGLCFDEEYNIVSADGFVLKCLKGSNAHAYAAYYQLDVRLLNDSDPASREQQLKKAFEEDGKSIISVGVYKFNRYLTDSGDLVIDEDFDDSELGVYTLKFADTDSDGEDELLAFEIKRSNNSCELQLRITGYDIDESGNVISASFEPEGFNNEHLLYDYSGDSRKFIGVEDGKIVLLEYFVFDSDDFEYSVLKFKNGEFTQTELFRAYTRGVDGEEDICAVYAENGDQLVYGKIGSDEIREQIAGVVEKTFDYLPELTLFPIDEQGNPRIFDENGDLSFSSLFDQSVLVMWDDVDVESGELFFNVLDNTDTYSKYYSKIGDATGDGKIDIDDCVLIMDYYVKRIPESAINITLADATGDGRVDLDDALTILDWCV